MSRQKRAALGATNTESGRELGSGAALHFPEAILPHRRYRRKEFVHSVCVKYALASNSSG